MNKAMRAVRRATVRWAVIKKVRQRMNNQQTIEHIKRLIEHDISVIALCQRGGQHHAQASYEAHLAELREQLKMLEEEQKQ
jgi:hypothetical protein